MNKPEPRYPPAPELHGELLLDVFTHRSLRQDGGSADNEKYAVLGERVFEASLIHCIILCHPHFGREEIEEEQARQLTDQNYEQWTNYYRFRDKLRFNGNAIEEVNSAEGAREIFHAYVGGVYTQANGPITVNVWVYLLITPPQERYKLGEKMPSYFPSQPPPPSHPFPMQPPPPPPSQHADFYPSRSRTNSISSARNVSMSIDETLDGVPYTTPSTGKSAYLPRFNEITSQRRLIVHYPAEQRGYQHAPRWVVKCIVDGKEMGVGAATTKQLAKEEAAKQAFYALNFSMVGS